MTAPRYVIALDGIYRSSGGIYQFTDMVIRRLLQEGASVTLIATSPYVTDYKSELSIAYLDSSIRITRPLSKLLHLIFSLFRLDRSSQFFSAIDTSTHVYVPLSQPLPWSLLIPRHKLIYIIHDCQHLTSPQNFKFFERLKRSIYFRACLFSGRLIHCESVDVRNQLQHFFPFFSSFPEFSIFPVSEPSKFSITPRSSDPLSFYLNYRDSLLNDSPTYIYYPASSWIHKNHLNLILALNHFILNSRLPLRLLLSGAVHSHYEPVSTLIKDLKLQDHVIHLGYVSDETVSELISHSLALIMPSYSESVSIPIFDAYQLGVPVLCSNISPLAEQIADCCITFDPFDHISISQSLHQLIADPRQVEANLHNSLLRLESYKSRSFLASLDRYNT